METLRVRVLGGLSVDGLDERQLGSRKGRTLLKMLALGRGAPVPVDRLADALWDEDGPARPAEQVAVLVSRLRAVLGRDRLWRSDAGYALSLDWLDLDEVADRVTQASTALGAGRADLALSAVQDALALARGPLLPDEDASWAVAERLAADRVVAHARLLGAEAALLAGETAEAASLAQDVLALDPYDESAARLLMRAHAQAGRPASALSVYLAVRERLGDELGIVPSVETEALHDAIVVGDPSLTSGRARRDDVRFVGREPQLAALEVALGCSATQDQPVIAEVLGEAGIGKTALVDAWTRRLSGRALVLAGRCDPLGRDLPLQPVLEALAVVLAAMPPGLQDEVLAGDRGGLGTLLGLDAPGASPRNLLLQDADMGRVGIFTALAGLTQRLSPARPAVLVVEDVHLADTSTLAWLQFLSRRRLRLLVVLTTRPVPVPTLPVDRSIALGPLDLPAAVELVGRERAETLHQRSGGQPLLLLALASSDDLEHPPSLAGAVERRLAGLGAAAATVRAAAVVGSDVDLDLLADVLDMPALTLVEHLEAAASAGLLVERAGGYRFRHELEREVLEGSSSGARRALLHRRAGHALARSPAPDPLDVAVHAHLGGASDLAVEWYLVAAAVAVARYDLPAADSHLSAAVDLAPSGQTYEARARVRMAALRLEEAADDAARARQLGGGASALEVAGWVAYYRRRHDEARRYADEAVRRAPDAAVRASCLALSGRARHGAGNLREGSALLESAVGHDGDSEIRNLAAVWLAHARLHAGRPHEALAVLEPAMIDGDQTDHPFAPLHARFAHALALGQVGRVGDALAACDELDRSIERAGLVGLRLVGPARNTRAWVLRWSGRLDAADELNRAAIEASSDESRLEARYAGLLDLGSGRLLVNDLPGAAEVLDQLAPIAGWEGAMAWHQRHRWRLLQAQLALADGDRSTAAALAADVAADAGARQADRYRFLATAVEALAGGPASRDLDGLDEVVGGLGRCAALEGWPLVAALGVEFDVASWRREAARRAGAIVAVAPDAEAARGLVNRLLP